MKAKKNRKFKRNNFFLIACMIIVGFRVRVRFFQIIYERLLIFIFISPLAFISLLAMGDNLAASKRNFIHKTTFTTCSKKFIFPTKDLSFAVFLSQSHAYLLEIIFIYHAHQTLFPPLATICHTNDNSAWLTNDNL